MAPRLAPTPERDQAGVASADLQLYQGRGAWRLQGDTSVQRVGEDGLGWSVRTAAIHSSYRARLLADVAGGRWVSAPSGSDGRPWGALGTSVSWTPEHTQLSLSLRGRTHEPWAADPARDERWLAPTDDPHLDLGFRGVRQAWVQEGSIALDLSGWARVLEIRGAEQPAGPIAARAEAALRYAW